jgi:hypothetical protein
MADLVKKAPVFAIVWYFAIVVYSYWFASLPERAWFMSFGNGLLNSMIILLLVRVLVTLRQADAAAIRTVDRLARSDRLP